MSLSNPTPLRIGMSGTLFETSWRVAGRAVLGMQQAQGSYSWNEFDLQADAGQAATLVYELGESGPQWKLFTQFEPEYAMTVEDAASKRVGDTLDLGEGPLRITAVEQSRVLFTEGEAPEGEQTGATANYFNAESADSMVVISWTGQELEYYRGLTLERGLVEEAFGLRPPVPSAFALEGEEKSFGSRYLSAKLIGVVAAVGLALLFLLHRGEVRMRPVVVKLQHAPAAPLKVGAAGRLNDTLYRVSGHELIEIAQVGLRFERHEFQLQDESGQSALLVCGLEPEAADWVLFKALQPLEPLSPLQAGKVCLGESVNIDGVVAPVSVLFRSSIRSAEASTSAAEAGESVSYGFCGQSNGLVLLARWNQESIYFHAGKRLPRKTVAAAFSAGR